MLVFSKADRVSEDNRIIWKLAINIHLSNFIPHLVFVIPLLIAIGAINVWLKLQKRKNKRPPFTKNFLRSPGDSLDKKLRDYQLDFMIYIMMIPLFSLLAFSMYSWNRIKNTLFDEIIYLGLGFAGSGYFLYKMVKQVIKINQIRLGFEGERAIGEELNQLMLQGYRVFHDIPKDMAGNIDHVVVGKNGVFAVETKAISKSERGRGDHAVKLKYDGKQLIFPSGQKSNKAIEQSRIHAKWLKNWLSKSLGESVAVTPVVTIPGWYIDRIASSKDVFVLAGGEINKSFKTLRGRTLSSQEMEKIAHQLDQRCRTVEAWVPDKKAG